MSPLPYRFFGFLFFTFFPLIRRPVVSVGCLHSLLLLADYNRTCFSRRFPFGPVMHLPCFFALVDVAVVFWKTLRSTIRLM